MKTLISALAIGLSLQASAECHYNFERGKRHVLVAIKYSEDSDELIEAAKRVNASYGNKAPNSELCLLYSHAIKHTRSSNIHYELAAKSYALAENDCALENAERAIDNHILARTSLDSQTQFIARLVQIMANISCHERFQR